MVTNDTAQTVINELPITYKRGLSCSLNSLKEKKKHFFHILNYIFYIFSYFFVIYVPVYVY